MSDINDRVRAYWEAEPCGTWAQVVGDAPSHSREWFERVESHRYALEPFIHSVAQFTRHRGKRVLEVGVGAGTDHLQWARAGCECHGVDLTDAAIETTRRHLAIHGLASDLRRVDAQRLPYEDASMDLVYSWGVIHHAEDPAAIVAEIHRVLKPGGEFVGMLYGRRSLVVLKLWIRHALLAGRPLRTFSDVLWHHMESVGTKAYTLGELEAMFGAFARVRLEPIVTSHDRNRVPRWVVALLPRSWGCFVAIQAQK
jgi:ubiquinone/menaquinone biosynthesis C-methylase UbiE